MNYNKLTKKELITLLKLREKPVTVQSTDEVFNFLKPYWSVEQEKFIVLLLDGAFKVKNVKVVSIGLVNKTIVHPREVFAPAIENRAVAVIVAHNHPSGNLTPSKDDFYTYDKLKYAGNMLGIKVLDSIIFTAETYYSMEKDD